MTNRISHPSLRPLLGRLVLVPLIAAAVLAAPAAAQQAGSITGEIRDRTTGDPLNGVQVSVVGTDRGGLTDARGRYLIQGVPAGEQTVEAVYIGYRTEQQTVTVAAGATAQANFELGVSAVSLDEVVVTGTAGAVERRQLGATVASVDVSKVQEKVPVATVGTVLQARIPGVRSMATVGGVGASRDLRIRGTTSMELGQRPVVYIDGVRVDTRQTEWGTTISSCCSFSGGAGEDRLSDLNPNDIERIEVIKGPAAGTLYGSEGSNGVIQIFTKRGRNDSAPRWTLSMTTGFQRYRENFQTKFWPRFTGPDGTRALDANETLIENGLYQGIDMAIQGGGNSVTYFVSGGYLDEEGSVQPNGQKRGNLRLNLHWLRSERLSFDVTSAFTRTRIASLQSGNNWTALLGNAILGNPTKATEERPWGEPWVSVAAIQDIETFDDATRWTGGFALNYNPSDRFTNKVQFGLDAVNEEKSRLFPFGHAYVYVPEGEKALGYRNARIFTADYLATLNFDLAETLGTTFSLGAQGFWEEERWNMAVGRGYAAPGVTTVGGGTVTEATESYEKEIQVGVFGQNRLAWQDKVFFTAGLRVDGNSAFGDNYGLQYYPNLQLSYDMSSEPFLPAFISQARVRGAFGMAGRAPGAFDKFLTFEPITVLDDEPGVQPENPGNADLKPERTTEIEGGFELGFWNDRVGLEFTAYRAVTRDALLEVDLPPSTHFGDDEPLQNVGTVHNLGWEAALRVTPYESGTLRWTTDLRMDGNENEVTSLGRDAAADTAYLVRGGYYVGFPVLHRRARVPVGFDRERIRHERSDTSHYIGPSLPTFNITLGNELTFGPFRLHGLLTAERGAFFSNSDRPYRVRFRTGDEYLATLDYSKCRPDGMCVESEMRTFKSDSLFDYMNRFSTNDERDNIRIRELSLAYSVPQEWTSRLGLGTTTLSVSALNVHWWDECNCMDPNMNYEGGASLDVDGGFLAMPAPRQFLINLRTSF